MNLGDCLTQMQDEEMKRFNDLPTPIKYTSDNCEKCNRVRVEEYTNGHLICEKCDWNHTTKEYYDRPY